MNYFYFMQFFSTLPIIRNVRSSANDMQEKNSRLKSAHDYYFVPRFAK